MKTKQSTRRTHLGVAGAVGLSVSLFAAVATVAPANANSAGTDEHKVTLCHATGSTTNPYVEITVDYDSIIKAGHGDHAGPVFDAELPEHAAWGDIIPPFDFGGDAVHAGMNLSAEGQVMLANGCEAPMTEPPVTEPTPTVPPVTEPTPTVPPVIEPAEHKVTLCHATHSESNPYVTITVDYHSIIQAGHGDHAGPIYSAELPKHTAWGDIIPPFDFGGDAVYAGMNWTDEGQAVFAEDCTAVVVPPTTTPPTTAPPVVEPPATVIPKPVLPAPVVPTVMGETLDEVPTPAPVEVAPAQPEAQVLGASVSRQATGTLPVTGSGSGPLVALSLALVSGGLLLAAGARRSLS